MLRRLAFLLVAISLAGTLFAKESPNIITHDLKIQFRQSKSYLDPKLGTNPATLKEIADSLYMGRQDSVWQLRAVHVTGAASPEGSVSFNEQLSRDRAATFFEYMSRYGQLPDSLLTFTFKGRDWKGLLALVESDAKVPSRDETIEFINDVIARSADGEKEEDDNVARFRRLAGGRPYLYLYHKHFPTLRMSSVTLTYEKVWNPARLGHFPLAVPLLKPDTHAAPDSGSIVIDDEFAASLRKKPFYMGVKTNMLYDILAVPNIGVEFYLGKNWTIHANWMYAWWKTDRSHWYWRTYGGEIAVRKWFGSQAALKPMQGHHIGVYAQVLTYDFELGGKGQIGGVPGGTMFDKLHWGAGIEYGYSLPVARRFNIDFVIGVGYLAGEYWEYKPVDDCYVWQATKQRRWFGPTKAEVSLVWLIGYGNDNSLKKGGVR